MPLDVSQHPCFNSDVRHKVARVHLPVAPLCNIQCKFCNRRYDCANESRPGVTSVVLSPGQALYYLDNLMEKTPEIKVVGIAGPGDPFANVKETMETLRLVRKHYPSMLLCVASNGLQTAAYAEELAELEVSHVTLTINAVDPEIGANIYAWVRDGKRIYRGVDGASLLLERQTAAVKALASRGVTVKVNAIVVPGVNDGHISAIAQSVSEWGASILNAIPLYPVAGTEFGDIPTPTPESMKELRGELRQYLPQMEHCTRCRADAVGLLGAAPNPEHLIQLEKAASQPINPQEQRPYVAVASREGMLVNMHLGEADKFYIYGEEKGRYQLMASRAAPAPGGGNERWNDLADSLKDCRAVLAASAGKTPSMVLEQRGLRVVMMEGLIEEGLDAVYRNLPIRAPLRKEHACGSGASCGGNGMGCM